MQETRKYYIFLKGAKVEVNREVYEAYYQEERKVKYITEKDKAHNVVLLNISCMEELEAECDQSFLASPEPSIDEQLASKELRNCLHHCLQLLPKADRELIQAIYFDGETEKAYAQRIGISQPGVNYQRKKILMKLRDLLKKIGGYSESFIFPL